MSKRDETAARRRREGELPRRDLILTAAADLFAARGYDGTSMIEIARAAGLSKAGVYHHFSDKDAIFSAISIATLEAMCEEAEAAVSKAESAGERLLAFMAAHGEYVDRHRPLYVAAHFAFPRMTDEPSRAEAMRLRDRYERCVRGIVADGVERGEFRTPDVALAARLVLAALNSLARWHKPQGPVSAADAARGFFRLVTEGLRN